MTTPLPVIFQWEASALHGWGIYGLNLALNAPKFGRSVASSCPMRFDEGELDNARRWALTDFFADSAALTQLLKPYEGRVNLTGCLALHSLGNHLVSSGVSARGNELEVFGKRTYGIAFLENTALGAPAIERARKYEKIIVGSAWNAEVLQATGISQTEVVHQGVDLSLFHPAPSSGLFGDRFVIFSGGKLETRKGQDLVLKAFRIFQQRHPDALLVTAWQSPWPAISVQSMSDVGMPTVPLWANGKIDVSAWAGKNGIDPRSVVDLGTVPNAQMPQMLREADVAVFANRCEGGTNLVAMEAMACGIPVILSANTGHRDLIRTDNCYILTRQLPVHTTTAGLGTEGWGESDPDEIVAHLEAIYADRDTARARAGIAAAGMATLNWRDQIGALFRAID